MFRIAQVSGQVLICLGCNGVTWRDWLFMQEISAEESKGLCLVLFSSYRIYLVEVIASVCH